MVYCLSIKLLSMCDFWTPSKLCMNLIVDEMYVINMSLAVLE